MARSVSSACRRGIWSQSSRSSADSSPQLEAMACAVVGRRTPTVARVVPDNALKMLDLPDPVAPASATTVALPEMASRRSA